MEILLNYRTFNPMNEELDRALNRLLTHINRIKHMNESGELITLNIANSTIHGINDLIEETNENRSL